jgi:hypothetical protein
MVLLVVYSNSISNTNTTKDIQMTNEINGANSYHTLDVDTAFSDNQHEQISIEVVNGGAELLIETVDKFGDDSFTYAHMNRDQLWEHIHNCLNALNGMK